jgi:hypothetical protein
LLWPFDCGTGLFVAGVVVVIVPMAELVTTTGAVDAPSDGTAVGRMTGPATTVGVVVGETTTGVAAGSRTRRTPTGRSMLMTVSAASLSS